MKTPPANQLLAKSPRLGRHVTLVEHAFDTGKAAQLLFGTPDGDPTALGRSWLRFFKVPPENSRRFLRATSLAGILHDGGKANDGFQRAIRQPGFQQAVRHEHLSAVMLGTGVLADWLGKSLTDLELLAVLSAVASHHCKVGPGTEHGERKLGTNLSGVASVELYFDAPEFNSMLRLAGEITRNAPPAQSRTRWSFTEDIYPRSDEFIKRMRHLARQSRLSAEVWPFVRAVKAALVAADSASSAASRTATDPEEWLRSVFAGDPLTADEIRTSVIEPRIAELERKGVWHGYHNFQRACSDLGERALLLSGCGSGKTLAAWKWIEAQLESECYRRVVFLYPTRATATEGFRDYSAWAGPEAAALIHGTAAFELESMSIPVPCRGERRPRRRR